ncbi:fused MFS/spermidine synthase [Candidatus Peregrinibacteria bacterium]|nr:fused MFS/spermidine synthase [Candidatus Peregrinibacteria bacterium]
MPRFFLYLTVFITGMAIMAIELTASRLLAPYFGASLFVWTNVIGVVLIALSLGYYIGGRLADRDQGRFAEKILHPLIFAAGIAVCLIPFFGKPIFLLAYRSISAYNTPIFLTSLASTFILFTIPLLILGMVNPLAARIGIQKLSDAGRVVGSLYAFSTIGSISGTFLPVMLTIPFLGSRETFFLFGGVLIALGVLGIGKKALFLFLAIPAVLFASSSKIHADSSVEYEGESIYNYIRVRKDASDTRYLLTNEGQGTQSLYHPSRILTGYYWDAATLLPALNRKGKDFLILGTAGASSARVLYHYFPWLQLEGVEIDPLMIQVARRFFSADQIPMPIHLSDGRILLSQSSKKYDFVMVDVYKDEFYIPFHLATREFFELVRDRLNPNGSMAMNIAVSSQSSELLGMIKNTVAAVFPYTLVVREPASSNFLIYGFFEKPDLRASLFEDLPLDLRSVLTGISKNITSFSFDSLEPIATDNLSPLEWFTEKMVLSEALG